VRTLLKILGLLIVLVLVVAAGVYLWAGYKTSQQFAARFDVHTTDFPIPFPLTPEETAGLDPKDDAALGVVARERAIDRGKHLVASRYPCMECHGKNFGGGTMIDAFPIGKLLGPNITTGSGSRTLEYAASDWDRIVRHGIRKDGVPAVMPSEDFVRMSDQELSDIVTYIRSMPAVNNTVPQPSFGPLGRVLVATGELKLSAAVIEHASGHRSTPPPTEATAAFGQHLANVCIGCHRPDFSGGPIVGGDPSWAPARNITPAPGALGGWTFANFATAMREGKRPDGTDLKPPMSLLMPYAKAKSDVELQALWMYLQSLKPIAPAAN
jgi:mono/diheme cytochrome c family protein